MVFLALLQKMLLPDFFNISMSYREDADIQHRYYGYLENIAVLHENLTETIEAFGSENRHIAKKKSLVNFYLSSKVWL